MARIARVVVPGTPHHIMQRGNRRQQTFFDDGDYDAYKVLMAEWCGKYGVSIWAWCLMANHVHLIAVPSTADGLARAIGEAHRRYTRHVNFREGWLGYLWQGRFGSYAMDEEHLLAAARYIEMNPVRAGIVERPGDYLWSSASAHLAGKDDGLASVKPLLDIAGNWEHFLAMDIDELTAAKIEKHGRTGRPLGESAFVEEIERKINRELAPKKAGRKKKGIETNV